MDLLTIFLQQGSVSTDTRTISEGAIFFALKGESFNANDFVHAAFEKGAHFAVVDEAQGVINDHCILVDNVLVALQDLARSYRAMFDIPVLGITGSNGKTTTKELCAAVLSKKFDLHYTKGNLNNHIGVPLTILAAPRNCNFLLIEMGANHIGEIAALCEIARPNYGLITNIGKAHIEGFGSVEGVIKAKSELYNFIIKHSGTIIYNADDNILVNLVHDYNKTKEYRPSSLTLLSTHPTIKLSYGENHIMTHLFGSYNVDNIAAAITLAHMFEISDLLVVDALEAYKPQNNRSQWVQVGTNSIILDAYNANPSSMASALKSFESIEGSSKVVILGDMLELGHAATKEHEKIVKQVSQMGFQETIFVGPEFFKLKGKYGGKFYQNMLEAKAIVNIIQYQNTTFLLKGSRGIAIEKLLPTPSNT